MQYRLTLAAPEEQDWLDELRRAVYESLFIATWGKWDEDRHLRHFAQCWQKGNISTVEIEGERVGMIQLLENDDVVEVGEIQIQPSHQGRGIGSRLLRDTMAQAHVRGKGVVLSAGLQNLRAVNLYERLGFKHTSQSETHFHMASLPKARQCQQ